MTSISSLMADMKAAGAPLEAIMVAVEAIEEARARAVEAERELTEARTKRAVQKQRERQLTLEVEENVARQSRDSRATETDDFAQQAENVARLSPDDPSSPPPPKRYNQTPSTPPSLSVEARARDWFAEEFYPGWPNKVGRAAAERAAVALFRKRRGDMAAVIEGRDRYVRDKPGDRPWLNPATFLNQERFDDRPASPPARAGPASKPLDGTTAVLRKISEARHDQQHLDDHQNGSEAGASDARASSLSRQADERGRHQWGGPQLDLVAVGSDRR